MNDAEHHKAIHGCCEPLFILHPFLQSGHSAQTANATVTYVKYQRRFYAVTCKHVIESLKEVNTKNGAKPQLATAHGRSFNFYKRLDPVTREFLPSFVTPALDEELDIAIHSFGEVLPTFVSEKGKLPIDLDKFLDVRWGEVKLCAAAGFGTEHKYQSSDKVAAPMHVVVAELSNSIRDDTEKIILSSALDKAHGTYFSGMSGGPLFAEDESGPPIFAGIVFEGTPGSSKAWDERDRDQVFVNENDILIKAHRVTPAIFDRWISACRWP